MFLYLEKIKNNFLTILFIKKEKINNDKKIKENKKININKPLSGSLAKV